MQHQPRTHIVTPCLTAPAIHHYLKKFSYTRQPFTLKQLPCPPRYTISGWVAFFLVLGLAVVFWCIFKDPTEEERRRVLPPSVQTVDENAQV
jgi:hypothetical protein